MSTAPRMVDAVDDFLVALSAAKPSPHTLAAYRRDLVGVAARVAIAQGVSLDELTLAALDKASLRRGFASWAADHAKASTIRAWSAWNAFFRHLVADDVVEGNPMDGVGKPKRPRAPVKVIRGPDVTARLLAAAATPDPRARHPWPERDTALVATFAVTGMRLGEALALTVACVDGPPGERRLSVVGKGDKARTLPIYSALESVLEAYLASRAARFPAHDLTRPTTVLFVHHAGNALTPRQVQYLIERLYRRAGIRAQVPPGALVHALRHTFATTALEGGANVVEVQQLLGHASLDTTKRYLEATANELRDAVRAHPSHLALQDHLTRSAEGRHPSGAG
ncbi:MAG TPA: tyrosine-type recombinase/integrase [Acidimicrobiales bacterium]|nr:tyrosine-type recombinase/integrase [Acidimicrobiales bacterium]